MSILSNSFVRLGRQKFYMILENFKFGPGFFFFSSKLKCINIFFLLYITAMSDTDSYVFTKTRSRRSLGHSVIKKQKYKRGRIHGNPCSKSQFFLASIVVVVIVITIWDHFVSFSICFVLSVSCLLLSLLLCFKIIAHTCKSRAKLM